MCVKKGFLKQLQLYIFADFFIKSPTAFRYLLIWALRAFGNYFMTALAAFYKISRNKKMFSYKQFKKLF